MVKILRTEELSSGYGELTVVRNISLEVNEREVIALIGANGAGKTTILKTICGLLPLGKGKIWFLERQIDSLPTYEIAQMGLILVPEGRKLFQSMRVLENLEMGAHTRIANEQMTENLQKVFSLFPVLQTRSSQAAGKLSGGEQTMLAIARGLMAAPKLLLLDEPSLGLAPMLIAEVFHSLREICAGGLSVLLGEQNVHHALSISSRGYVLELGKIRLHDKSEILRSEDSIRKAYLGV